MFKPFICVATLLFSLSPAQALPIDWHGVLGIDTTVIDGYRRVEATTVNSTGDGSMEPNLPAGGSVNANFQNYVFRLQPNIVVNDSATIKAEFSNGYARGGFVGDDSAIDQNSPNNGSGSANQLYPYNFSSGRDGLVVNQLYAELYSDTATYVLGRHPQHFALGAVVDSGEDTWDRFSYLRDGITIKIKLGSFKIEPYWTRVDGGNSLTKGTRVKDYGVSLVYDSLERDMAFGILYNKKQTTTDSQNYQTSVGTAGNQTLGPADVKLTDIYFKKSFGQFDLAVEVPIFSGEIGNVYTGNTPYKAQAIIVESNLKLNAGWDVGLDVGKVSGDDGSQGSFDAMYLNPNYQVANILFRYNLNGIANRTNYNVYDSYINNATYLRFRADYKTEKWRWDLAAIYAKADQVAKAGQLAYNHFKNESFTANYDQQDDLGLEFDTGFEYKWNSEITIGGQFGYLLTGDYFGYTNTATKNNVDNSYLLQLRAAVTF